jgi:hypothetical protein
MATEYSKETQAGKAKEKDPRSFREKYATPIKKKAYELKRTPLKKPDKPISKVSANKARQRKTVAQEVASKAEQTPLFCQSCGCTDSPLDPSHLLQQARSIEYAAKAINIHWHCRTRCHDLAENQHYYLMNDGLEIMTKLWMMGEAGKQRLRSALQKWDGLNLDRFQLSPVYPEYLEEQEAFI